MLLGSEPINGSRCAWARVGAQARAQAKARGRGVRLGQAQA